VEAFNRLAKLTVRYHRWTFLVWAIIFLLALPAILNANEQVSYTQEGDTFSETESARAESLIAAQFPVTQANSSLIIVLEDRQLDSSAVRDFTIAFGTALQSNASLSYFDSYTSLYSVYEQYLVGVIFQTAPLAAAAEAGTEAMLGTIFGIPSAFLDAWNLTGGNTAAADALLRPTLQAQYGSEWANVSGYYLAFLDAWNASDPQLSWSYRLSQAVHNAVQTTAPLLPPELAVQYLQLEATFSVLTWTNETLRHQAVAAQIYAASGLPVGLVLPILPLGGSPDPLTVYALAHSFVVGGTIDTYPISLPENLQERFLSGYRDTMLLFVGFSVGESFQTDDGDRPIARNVEIVRELLRSAVESSGLTSLKAYVTGGPALSYDIERTSLEENALIFQLTFILLIALTAAFFRSVLTPAMTLGGISIAIGLAQAVIFMVGFLYAKVDFMVTTVLTTVLLGVGTDYSIFIIARYREERVRGLAKQPAMIEALTWAGESVTTSGVAVILSFAVLSLGNLSLLKTWGPVLGLAITGALLISLTLVPSLVLEAGDRAFWPNSGKRWARYAGRVRRALERKSTYFAKSAEFSRRHARAVVLSGILVSVPAVYLALTIPTSFDFQGVLPEDLESVQGVQALSGGFGAGLVYPTQIVATFERALLTPQGPDLDLLDQVAALSAYLLEDDYLAGSGASDEIVSVQSPTMQGQTAIDYTAFYNLTASEQQALLSQIAPNIGADGRTVLFTVVLSSTPFSNPALDHLEALRTGLEAQATNPDRRLETILVGGATAGTLDARDVVTPVFNRLEVYLVIGLFVILTLVLGSLVLPTYAVASVGMSIAQTIALAYFVFDVLQGIPILWILPIFIFMILMGLGMDYNIFILTRVREEAEKGRPHTEAITTAVERTGGIITAAAVILAGSLGALMLSDLKFLQQIGFALSVSILLDAMIVRTYFMPALMHLTGERMWWAPSKLQRVKLRAPPAAGK